MSETPKKKLFYLTWYLRDLAIWYIHPNDPKWFRLEQKLTNNRQAEFTISRKSITKDKSNFLQHYIISKSTNIGYLLSLASIEAL